MQYNRSLVYHKRCYSTCNVTGPFSSGGSVALDLPMIHPEPVAQMNVILTNRELKILISLISMISIC